MSFSTNFTAASRELSIYAKLSVARYLRSSTKLCHSAALKKVVIASHLSRGVAGTDAATRGWTRLNLQQRDADADLIVSSLGRT